MATSNQFYDPLRQAELAQYGGMTAAQYANSLFKQDTAPVSLPNGGLVLQAGRGSTISPEDVQKYTASGMNLDQINTKFGDPAITQRIINPAVANPVVPYTPPASSTATAPTNAMANPWMTQPKAPPRQTAGSDPRTARAEFENANAMVGRSSQLQAIRNYGPASTPAAGGFTETPSGNTMPTQAGGYPGGRGNYMGYGPNGGGLRVDPNYLPEYWDNYQDSPEFKWRLAQAEKAMNRRLLAFGRSDSSGGHNIMGNLYSDITADERDKQYQRNLMANTENYQRYLGANNINYGRTQSEDQTGWNRAWDIDNRDWTRSNYLGEQDWNRNFALANMGFDATRSGVGAGTGASLALAELLSQNGANQASLALRSGAVSADVIQALLSAGFDWARIERLFSPLGGVPGPGAPPLTPPSGAGVGAPPPPSGGRDWLDPRYGNM